MKRRSSTSPIFLESKQLKINPTAIVFDFDLTLTSKHAYSILDGGASSNMEWRDWVISDTQFIEDVFGGRDRLDQMGKFIDDLKASNVDLFISTTGYVDNVVKILTQAGELGTGLNVDQFQEIQGAMRPNVDVDPDYFPLHPYNRYGDQFKDITSAPSMTYIVSSKQTVPFAIPNFGITHQSKEDYVTKLKDESGYNKCLAFIDDSYETKRSYSRGMSNYDYFKRRDIMVFDIPQRKGLTSDQREQVLKWVKECDGINCKIGAKFVCKGCKIAQYCSKDCQLSHWSTHKSTCCQK